MNKNFEELTSVENKILTLLVEFTKFEKIQWSRLKYFSRHKEDHFRSLHYYQQEQLLDGNVLNGDNSFFSMIKDFIVLCLCFKNIETDATSYHICLYDLSGKKLTRLTSNESDLIYRLANLIRFTSDALDKSSMTQQLNFLKDVYQDLNDH